jgi:hypothetical protein
MVVKVNILYSPATLPQRNCPEHPSDMRIDLNIILEVVAKGNNVTAVGNQAHVLKINSHRSINLVKVRTETNFFSTLLKILNPQMYLNILIRRV